LFFQSRNRVPRRLTISNELLSLRGRITILDQLRQPAYEAHGSFALLRPTWTISRGSREVATIRRKILSLTSSWKIKGELGSFTLRRKLLAWTRRYRAIGGPFNGAILSSGIWDVKFQIRHQDVVLARAASALLTVRDRQVIELLQEGDAVELFAVIVMVSLHLDHQDEKRERRSKRAE
jgi:uncharacterized protein YxjI